MKNMMCALALALFAVSAARGQEKIVTKEEAPEAFTGRCHCGQLKYEVTGKIIKQSYCDCRGCQRATATLKAPFVTVLRSALKVTGTPTEFRAKSGVKCDVHGVWVFCAKCGTQVFWKGDKGNQMDIFAGTLDNTKLFQPDKK
ncbi:MAG: GFA family protein [Victivallales bacterium]|jgi:hypothetical protein|nr:GFA family protein [Victivallales bacterium]MBT7164407.1 GFA family protein [Victivallales bacterium]